MNVSLNDPRSPFRVLHWDEYQAASPGDVLEIFREKNLVITDRPLQDSVGVVGPVSFDEKGLRHLGPLSRSVVMHGKSYFFYFFIFLFGSLLTLSTYTRSFKTSR